MTEANSEIIPKQNNDILKHAWKLFAVYDKNAIIQQSLYKKFQFAILLLGIIVTILSLASATISPQQFTQTNNNNNGTSSSGQTTQINNNTTESTSELFLRYVIIILPISISILVASSTYFKYGNKWVMLRNAAEEIKSEIYQYRTRVGNYKENKDSPNDQQKPLKPEEKLSQQVEIINNQLMSSEVGLSSLSKYDGKLPPKMYGAAENDDGFSVLDPDKYVSIRIDDQINYYQGKTGRMYKNLQILQWSIFIAGGIGTFIAALGLELWVALTSTIVSVFTIYLQYNQIENTLIKYNQALTQLNNIKAWWSILSEEQKKDPLNIDKLINATELTLVTEHQTWIKNIKDAVSKIHTIEKSEKGKQGNSQ
ncbi:MAG TPA: DUF4231 domain-containing protein [Nitrososphaeraceae archaeon]|nr:DUF4231 domain-containing protein [Nitrososphaeraceae archaeon]